ncbi:hypothetical protein [Bradyrhizobium sp. MOS002]|uniref:hypothetical protein n=1 Tax=Bradyrhizobium sp. MOS002 TaxID=2133947 RepID=UPI000D13781E|nr:hypothetical protein [Bradyrhizobium sp. MOS002]PSO26033.1 hypothetical protein C7G41_29105 [Bradyrhizobium sp. MOS002]
MIGRYLLIMQQEFAPSQIVLARRSWAIFILIVSVYAVAILVPLARHNFDASIFILAGDRFVTADSIRVIRNADGYDGQYYYRLAIDPFSRSERVAGVKFDNGPFRMQRIIYPLLAFTLSGGRPEVVPLALITVNLLGLLCIWVFAIRLKGPAWVPIAILLWPGFITSLTHDTTEIASAAFLLIALYFHISKRAAAFAVFATVAVLTRETNIVVVCGLAALEFLRRDWHRMALTASPLIPFFAWRTFLTWYWGVSPTSGTEGNITWPFAGALQALLSASPWNVAGELFALAVLAVGFYGAAKTFLRAPLSEWDYFAAWTPLAFVMSILSAGGPWIATTAFFRAFTECYVLTCLLAGSRIAFRTRLLAGVAALWFMSWGIAVAQLR